MAMAWTSNRQEFRVGQRLNLKLKRGTKNARLYAEEGGNTLLVREDLWDSEEGSPPEYEGEVWLCEIVGESQGPNGSRGIFDVKPIKRADESDNERHWPKARRKTRGAIAAA